MASKSPKPAGGTGRSRRASINERHFARTTGKPSARQARKPVINLDGSRILSVTYVGIRENGTDLVLLADALQAAPNLAPALVAAFTRTLRANRPKRQVQQFWSSLSEFAQSLAKTDPQVTFETLERKHLVGFRAWLNKQNADGLTRRSKITRTTAILNVQTLLRATGLCDHVDFLKRPYTSADGSSIRRVKRKSSRPIPKPDAARMLLQAVLREIKATMTLRAAFLDPSHPALGDPATRATVALAHRLKERHKCELPDAKTLKQIVRTNPGRRAGPKAGSRTAVPAYMPTLATIAPFCILLMIALRLDGQMLADLLQKNLKVVEHIGVERLQAVSWRSKVKDWKTTTATLSGHWHSPDKLVRFLDDWTEDLREIASQKMKGRQFIVASRGAAHGVVALNHAQGIGRAITEFCDRNGLQRITSSIPRKLAIDLADMLSHGDIGVRAQAGMHDQEVNLAHYDTHEAVARGDDAYGLGVMLLTAHRRDNGRTPDKRTYMPDEDVMAATPGWWCSNPFDPPPGSGESGRRPCAAYGMCPTCPNGEPDLTDPVSCKRVGLLLEAILRSEPNMPPEVWEGTWKPVADELAFKYIPMFEVLPEVTAAAAELDIGPMMEVVRAQHT